MKQKCSLSQFPFREKQLNQTNTTMSNSPTMPSFGKSKINEATNTKLKKSQSTSTSQPAKVSNMPSRNANNKVRNSRNAHGGVDFTTIPAHQEDVHSKNAVNPLTSSISSNSMSSNS